MDYSLPGFSLHGISQEEYWARLSFPSPEDIPDPAIKPVSPLLADRLFTESPGKSLVISKMWKIVIWGGCVNVTFKCYSLTHRYLVSFSDDD